MILGLELFLTLALATSQTVGFITPDPLQKYEHDLYVEVIDMSNGEAERLIVVVAKCNEFSLETMQTFHGCVEAVSAAAAALSSYEATSQYLEALKFTAPRAYVENQSGMGASAYPNIARYVGILSDIKSAIAIRNSRRSRS